MRRPSCSPTSNHATRALGLLKREFPQLEALDIAYRKSELAFRRNLDLAKARRIVAEHYPGLEIVDTQFALHLKHRDVNKATGMLKIAEIMGIEARNFAAVGDSENDLPMLKEAGLAIAVGNAAPELKAMADYVSKASYGDGAAEAFAWLRSQPLALYSRLFVLCNRTVIIYPYDGNGVLVLVRIIA